MSLRLLLAPASAVQSASRSLRIQIDQDDQYDFILFRDSYGPMRIAHESDWCVWM